MDITPSSGLQSPSPTSLQKENLFSESLLPYIWYFWLLLVIGNLLIFLIHLVHMPADQLAQFIYDDGYYYLVIAKNFTHYHVWTFDSGTTLTSGFQLLFAYCLAALYALFNPDSFQFIHIALYFTVLITLLSFIWLYLSNYQHKWALIAATTLIASSLNFSYNAITLVEWPLVIFFAGAYYYTLYQYNLNNHIWQSALSLFIVGCLGSLARIDFGAMPLALCFAAFIMQWITKNNRYFLLTLSGLTGATAGVIFVSLHNYYITGHWLQNSALMKLQWGYITGLSPFPFYAQMMSLLLGNFYREGLLSLSQGMILLFPILLFLCLIFFAYRAIILFTQNNVNSSSQQKISVALQKNSLLILGSIFTIIFYCIFYAFDTGALQPWYSGNVIVPIIILLTGIISAFHSRLSSTFISMILIIVIAAHFYQLYSLKITPWVSQGLLYKAGNYLQQQPLPGKIGSWNAGIVAYYEGQHIINLDGLMNDEIYPYIKTNQLECYFVKKQINYIVDFPAMFQNYCKERGGYTKNLQNWLTVIGTFTPPTPFYTDSITHHVVRYSNLYIYRVDLQGLAENNHC